MSQMTDYLENKLVDHIFRNRVFATPSTIYIGLYLSSGAPGDTTTGSAGGDAVSGTGYTRIQVGPSDTTWNATQGGTPASASTGTGGATANSSTITFPTPTGNWGSIASFGIFDATTAGNCLLYGTLTNAKTVNNGDPAPYFAAGALTVTFA